MLDMTGLLRKSFMLMDKKILLFLALSAAGYPLCSQAQSQFKLQTQEIKNADKDNKKVQHCAFVPSNIKKDVFWFLHLVVSLDGLLFYLS